MRKYWKRILAMVLVLMMVVPNNVTAFAAENLGNEVTEEPEQQTPEVYCEKCESLEHTAEAHCEVCGELDHAAEAHCAVCESLEHAVEAHCAVCGELDHAADAHCVKCDELGHVADDHCVDCDVFGHADKTSEDCEDYVIPCDNTKDCPAYIHEEGCPGEFVKCETDGCELVAGHPGECAGAITYEGETTISAEGITATWNDDYTVLTVSETPGSWNSLSESLKAYADYLNDAKKLNKVKVVYNLLGYKKEQELDWNYIKSKTLNFSANKEGIANKTSYVISANFNDTLSIPFVGELSGSGSISFPEFELVIGKQKELTTVNLEPGQRVNYVGTAVENATIVSKVFTSVTYANGTVTTNANDVTITTIEKNVASNWVPLTKAVDSVGQYRITVSYAGDDDYTESSASVVIEVVDERLDTEVVLDNTTLAKQTLATEYSIEYILNEMNFKVIDENGATVTNEPENVTVTVRKNGGLGETVSIIKETGVYGVNVSFNGNEIYKGCSTGLIPAQLTVTDGRYGTKVKLKDGELNMESFNDRFEKADILNAVRFSVESDSTVDVEEKDVILTVYDGNKVVDEIVKPGEYTVGVAYAGNNTHKASGEARAKLLVNDARKQPVITLKADQKISYTESDKVTKEEAFNLVFDSITDGIDYGYVAKNVVITDGESEITSEIDAIGTYYITVKYEGNDYFKPAEATVAFSVTDGRNITKVNITPGNIPYDFANGLDKDKIIKALNVYVEDITDNMIIDPSAYTVSFKKGENEIAPEKMILGETYTIVVVFPENARQLGVSRTENFKVVDGRYETTLNLKENQTITYSEDTTSENIFYLVFDSILGADNNTVKPVLKNTEDSTVMALSNGNVNVIITVPDSLNVGMHTAKVEFLGDNNYKPSKAEVDFEVLKASTSLNVNSATIKYSDMNGLYNAEDLIEKNSNAKYVSFAVGFGLGNDASTDASAVAYVDLPKLIDLDKIEDENTKKILQSVLDKLGGGTTMNVAELKSALKSFLSTAELLGVFGINLNLESINSLVSLLEQIEDLEGIGNLTIKLTMDKGLNISDAGVYLVGAVTSDANYETAYGLNYLIITPNGKKAELDWLIEDENGFVTISAIASGEYDLGAYVSKVYEGTEEDAEKQLVELFLGVDAEGNPILTTEQSELTFGAYTEIAFIKDLGNEMYYAVPIVRPVVVVTDLVDVKFVDLNGNENYDRIFTYDGTRKAMLAEAYDRAGNKLDSANITYRYIGIESDVENYYSSEAPTETGMYTVVAVYKEAGNTRVGMTVGAMVIQPAEAAVEVKDFVAVPYTEAPVDLVDTMEITTAPADAKVAIITGSVSAKGDFSEEGLDAVVGNLNIDLPERADEILEKLLGKDMETADITVKDLQRWVAELKTEISNLEDVEIDTAAFDELLEMLKDMPNVTSITFKDSIKPSAIGAYFVGAVVFDTNYIPNADAGILLITPEVENDELSWNYNDMNGIITLPALEEQDNLLAATAATGADVKYFIVGTDEYGKEVRIHTADISYDSLIKKGFGNGVYTQVAYIPFEADGNIAVGYPIVRSFVVAPQYVLIDFAPELNIETPVKFEYTGKPVDISTIVTYMDDTKVSEDKCNKYLTVRYVGVDSTGAEYNSTTAPTKEGVYTVTALYVERTEAGELIYAGLNVGLIEIIPASNNNNNQPEKPSDGSNKDDSKAELEGVYHPTSKTATKTAAMAKTGDSANVIGYACAVVAAGAALLYVFLKKKRA